MGQGITFIKNAVNNVLTSPPPNALNSGHWNCLLGRCNLLRYTFIPINTEQQSLHHSKHQGQRNSSETGYKCCSCFLKVSPENLHRQVNNAIGSQINLLGEAPQVIAEKQLKSRNAVVCNGQRCQAASGIVSYMQILHTLSQGNYMYSTIRTSHSLRRSKQFIHVNQIYYSCILPHHIY